jgi:hypothetical protein
MNSWFRWRLVGSWFVLSIGTLSLGVVPDSFAHVSALDQQAQSDMERPKLLAERDRLGELAVKLQS